MLIDVKNPASGYTIIEVVVVIVLLGILSAIAIPNFIDMRTEAKNSITKDELAALKRAIVGDGRVVAGGTYAFPGYEADIGSPPGGLNSLGTLCGGCTVYDPITRRGWRGPYVDSSTVNDATKDAWGNAYLYSSGSRYIRSKGANGTDDSGASDDITTNF